MHQALQRASRGFGDFFHDESADHISLPVIATLRDNMIVMSHVCSVVDNFAFAKRSETQNLSTFQGTKIGFIDINELESNMLLAYAAN